MRFSNPVAEEAWFSQPGPLEGEIVASSWNVRQLFSSDRTDWATPEGLFSRLDKQFAFELDACASHDNAKCEAYFTEQDDGLDQCWIAPDSFSSKASSEFRDFLSVWCNPPWGRKVGDWVEKGFKESREGCTVVMLLPACTDTRWWAQWVWQAAEVRLVTGRLKFVRGDGHTGPATKGTAVVVFAPWSQGPPAVRLMERGE